MKSFSIKQKGFLLMEQTMIVRKYRLVTVNLIDRPRRIIGKIKSESQLKLKQETESIISAAPPGFRLGGGDTLGGRPRGVRVRSPPDAREISKIFK